MKKIISIIILLLLAYPGLSRSEEWDAVDKALIGGLILTKSIDCSQTRQIYSDPYRWERNPAIRAGVDRFGRGFIPIYFVGTTLLTWKIADKIENGAMRKIVLGLALGLSLKTIDSNFKGGLVFRIPL